MNKGYRIGPFMGPHTGSPAVLQYRKWLSLFSRGDSMWCLFLETSRHENCGKNNMGFNVSNTDLALLYFPQGNLSKGTL